MDLTDSTRHLPWIVYGAIEWLETYLHKGMKILEWGSGGSTLFFAQRVSEVVSIEHDPEWYETVSRALKASDLTNCSYRLVEPRRHPLLEHAPYSAWLHNSQSFDRYRSFSFKDYVKEALQYPDEYFDLVLVDGRARASCLRHAVRKLKPGGVLMLDNSERAQYQDAMEGLRRMARRDFSGKGPFLNEPWRTTIWFKGPEPPDDRAARRFVRDYDVDRLGLVDVARFGFRMYVTPRFRERYQSEPYEELTSLLVRQSAKGAETFVDVGAHYGFFTVLTGLANPRCRLIAFEPVPENAEVLRRNLDLNGINAEVHEAAVSNVSGRLEFQVSEASDSSGFTANPAAGEARRIQRDVACLDDVLDRIGPGPLLVKIDVEGNEDKVLDGMRRTIDQHEDVRLVIEFNPRCLETNGTLPEALLDKLEHLGFDVFFVLDSERQYAKYRDVDDWRGLMQGKTSVNVYCAKKARSLSLCFFCHSAASGGAELSLAELIDRMSRRYGTLFTVVLPSDGPLKRRIEDLGAASLVADLQWWCSLPTSPVPSDIDALMRRSLESVYDALPTLWRLAPDVVLTNTIALPWGSIAAMKMGRPHIWWIKEFGELDHGLKFHLGFPETLKLITDASNHVVVNSQAVRDALFADAAAEKCSVATNCISLKPGTEATDEYFCQPAALKLMIAGRVDRPKGQDEALRALAKLAREGCNVELCVAGTMPDDSLFAAELQDIVATQSIETRVHFLGFLDNIRPLLEQADVVLTCSKNEAFGRTTAEAMMLGKPVIGTSSGGTPELIDDGVTGFLYPPGDHEQLAERIEFFVRNREELQAFGRRASRAVEAKLACSPVDYLLFDLCQNYKSGARNPYSAQLARHLLGWQQTGGQDRRSDGLGLVLLPGEAAQLQAQVSAKAAELDALHASTSWRLTAPLRRLTDLLRRRGV